MGRNDLINRFTNPKKQHIYQVVLCDTVGKLSTKIYEFLSLDESLKFLDGKRQDAQIRKPRRNKYMIWIRKGTWTAVTIESGFLRK